MPIFKKPHSVLPFDINELNKKPEEPKPEPKPEITPLPETDSESDYEVKPKPADKVVKINVKPPMKITPQESQWLKHVKQVRQNNPDIKEFKKILILAKSSYKKNSSA